MSTSFVGCSQVQRSAALSVRVEPAVKMAIAKAAKEDRRTIASLIEKVLVEWLRERGHLKPTD